jgi:hypothetical protein
MFTQKFDNKNLFIKTSVQICHELITQSIQPATVSTTKTVTGVGAVCDQKILVFVFQMEKSKNTWMG